MSKSDFHPTSKQKINGTTTNAEEGLLLPSINQLHPEIQKALLTIPESNRYVIALSGGLDSMALLCFALPYLQRKNSAIQVLHIHHGLSLNADKWASYCQDICTALKVSCDVRHVSVEPEGEGLEAAARKARYAVFESYLLSNSLDSKLLNGSSLEKDSDVKKTVLLQGHHLNDQAETVLMRVMRGAGPEGLSGIPRKRNCSEGIIFRPWLKLPRTLLEKEFKKLSVHWIEDESNSDSKFDRNYIRHQVLPVFEHRWKNILTELAKVSERAQETQTFISHWCQQQQVKLKAHHYQNEGALSLPELLTYSRVEQRILLRYWLDQFSVPQPPEKVLIRLWDEVIPASNDAQPEIRWGHFQIRRFDHCLFLLNLEKFSRVPYYHSLDFKALKTPFSLKLSTTMFELSRVKDGLDIDLADDQTRFIFIKNPNPNGIVSIRSRLGGETICLPEFQHSTTLKKVYQSNKVLPWLRSELPILFYGEDVVFVGLAQGGIIAKGFEKNAEDNCLLIKVSNRCP